MRVDEIVGAVVQRVKWNVVKNMMRNNDQGRRRDLLSNRLDQLAIKLAQMVLRRLQQQPGVRLYVRRLEMELRQLKRETFQRGSHGGSRRQIPDHFEFVSTDDECLKTIRNRVVLHENFVPPQHGLYFIDLGDLHALQRGPAGLFRSHFSEQLDEFLFASRDFFFRVRIGPRSSRRAKFVQAAVENIELSADLPDTLQAWRFIDTGIPDCLEIFFEQVDERP